MPNRKPMTAAELAEHHIGRGGRDYNLACDGYEDMEVAEAGGWSVIHAWGRDGWDLGNHPYVSIATRERDGVLQMQQIVEGDHDVYEFPSGEDRTAAIDYLFLWYAADEPWAPLKPEDRGQLDAGELAVDEKFSGPFSWDRVPPAPAPAAEPTAEPEIEAEA